jgi:two-component system, chemotaxis family, CheB/CheR fusion protein
MRAKKKTPKAKKSPARSKPADPLRAIVAIGASAGGLEAVSALLDNLSPDTGLSYFYIQHLSPDHSSELAMLLSKSTSMKVRDAKNGLKVERNCIYVCVPNKEMHLKNGKIILTARPRNKTPYLPIDSFFQSLAASYGNKVIGVILSGNASDGTLGLQAIKEAGGISFAQDSSAKYDSMAT